MELLFFDGFVNNLQLLIIILVRLMYATALTFVDDQHSFFDAWPESLDIGFLLYGRVLGFTRLIEVLIMHDATAIRHRLILLVNTLLTTLMSINSLRIK